MSHFTQCPDSRLDYVVNWADWLQDGDTLSVSRWQSDPMLTIESTSLTDSIATAFITGGDVGTTYTITNTITTASGRIHCQTFTLAVV